MNRTKSHKTTICTMCKHRGDICRPGYELISKLRNAVAAANGMVEDDFCIAGTAHLPGCNRSCTVAYHATLQETWLFGDVEPNEDIDELLSFAHDQAGRLDSWHPDRELPLAQVPHALGRLPAAVIAMETGNGAMS